MEKYKQLSHETNEQLTTTTPVPKINQVEVALSPSPHQTRIQDHQNFKPEPKMSLVKEIPTGYDLCILVFTAGTFSSGMLLRPSLLTSFVVLTVVS